MIISEACTIRGHEFIHTYSDRNMMIERNGVKYAEAYDPLGTDRVYRETFEPIRNDQEEFESENESKDRI